jgi:ketosteroid isomerase-like protein
VLQAYADAYSHLDAAAVKRVFPSANEQALKQAFSGARSYQVQVRDEQIRVSGNTATISCAWDVAFVGQVGGQQRQSSKITIRLQKSGGGWIIVERR